MTIDILIS